MEDSCRSHKTGKQIQTAILDYIRANKYVPMLPKNSIIAYKVEIANERGVPDLLCCVNGKFIALEIKGENDGLKPIQIAQIHRIMDAGGIAKVVTSLEEFKELLYVIGS